MNFRAIIAVFIFENPAISDNLLHDPQPGFGAFIKIPFFSKSAVVIIVNATMRAAVVKIKGQIRIFLSGTGGLINH